MGIGVKMVLVAAGLILIGAVIGMSLTILIVGKKRRDEK